MFNILTVGFTLWLNHQMQEAFGQSVEVGSAWERRLRDYGDMISIARAVQVRCNNVFITRDVVQQRDEMRLAYNNFKTRIRAKRSEAILAVENTESHKLIAEFDKLLTAVDEMVGTAENLFDHFPTDTPDQAARRLVDVNRDYATIVGVISDLRLRVSGIQARIFGRQMEEVARLRRMEYVVVILVLFMLGGAVFYGERVTQRMNADAEALDRAHHELLDTARRAGMAEVATGVLHNVGNVLNSVNVSASLVAESIRKSKVGNVERVARMLSENEAKLGDFLANDPKGKQIPAFLRYTL
jgi:hypothetical protein